MISRIVIVPRAHRHQKPGKLVSAFNASSIGVLPCDWRLCLGVVLVCSRVTQDVLSRSCIGVLPCDTRGPVSELYWCAPSDTGGAVSELYWCAPV
jgi:hypothetical protein